MAHRRRLAICLLLAGRLPAFEVQAVIKKIDLGQHVLYVIARDQDRAIPLNQDVKVFDAAGQPLADGLNSKDLQTGATVTLSVDRDGKRPVLRSIRLAGVSSTSARPALPSNSSSTELKQQDTSKLVPLTDLGTGEYQGFAGGLYPGGQNTRPPEHEAAGLRLAAQVQPLDAAGKPSPSGKIVLLAIGFSNTVQAFNGFKLVAEGDVDLNPQLVLVNGAVGGMSAARIQNPDDGASGTKYWKMVDEKLASTGVTREQAQVVWIKETDAGPYVAGFPQHIQTLQSELTKIVQVVPQRFPNVKLAYMSSRTYGGWAKTRPNGTPPGNSEPFSYESGFAYKWLIEQQIKGEPELAYSTGASPGKAPWLSWAAYLWTNGPKPRTDGVYFEPDDFREDDRMHESLAGQRKVGGLLLNFFKTDPTTKGWLVKK